MICDDDKEDKDEKKEQKSSLSSLPVYVVLYDPRTLCNNGLNSRLFIKSACMTRGKGNRGALWREYFANRSIY